MNSPKAQAEAMANNLVYEMFPGAYPKDVEGIKASISTALEKLLTENEGLKEHLRVEKEWVVSVNKDNGTLLAQLTATEAKLETGKKWMEHRNSCRIETAHNGSKCTCGLDAFLSTLTAAKKEQG